MHIPREILKTVAFVCFRNKISGSLVPVGSSFFLGIQPDANVPWASNVFITTARHVIDGLAAQGSESCVIRMNAKSPNQTFVEIEIPISEWKFNKTDDSIDVAICEHGLPADADHLVLPMTLGASDAILSEYGVDIGEDVFVSGLFAHHFGNEKNIPIVRVGNIAAMNEERIKTRKGDMDAFLIEARSIGGLSGSPVFINFGAMRQVGNSTLLGAPGPQHVLLGLIHGHFDVKKNDISSDQITEDAIKDSVNAGIAIVVPFEAIKETISQHLNDSSLSADLNRFNVANTALQFSRSLVQRT